MPSLLYHFRCILLSHLLQSLTITRNISKVCLINTTEHPQLLFKLSSNAQNEYFPISTICQISTISLHGFKTTHIKINLESSVILFGQWPIYTSYFTYAESFIFKSAFYPYYLLRNNLKKKKHCQQI